MKKFARLPQEEREELFSDMDIETGWSAAIAEKDFWVCYTLDYLFHRSPWKDSIIFKGGTSLSKAFGLITRFSEDIDLIIDWRLLGYSKDEPWQDRSKTQQDKFNKEANLKAATFLEDTFCPAIKEGISQELGFEAKIYIDEKDPQTVVFAYPKSFSAPYILPVIRLEIGPLAAWTPAKMATITSYAAEHYPNLFEEPSTDVMTVNPERTFWEKATILHQEAHRDKGSPMKRRYSRHYYDLHCMSKSPMKDIALANIHLLDKVVEFKKRFYPVNWANYDEAKPGTLKLVPPDYRMKELEADYIDMRYMLYGDIPSMDTIMNSIKELEREINSLVG